MIHLAYCSAAAKPMSSADLVTLLNLCRMNNARDGITGMLLYREASFMQVLEGDAAVVLETYARIARDRRHRDLKILDQTEITERSFDQWSMGFRNLSALCASDLDAFSPFLIEQFSAEHYGREGKALALLCMFREIAAGAQ